MELVSQQIGEGRGEPACLAWFVTVYMSLFEAVSLSAFFQW
jgi:hypothetical protein